MTRDINSLPRGLQKAQSYGIEEGRYFLLVQKKWRGEQVGCGVLTEKSLWVSFKLGICLIMNQTRN
jgi:hypothetical protein